LPLQSWTPPSSGLSPFWWGGVRAVPALPSVFEVHCLSFDFRCDPSEINISDEMPKTTVWKALSINSGNTKEKR
jgi:hypothetical protein